jgi:mono/diheme cytochrome c family protein
MKAFFGGIIFVAACLLIAGLLFVFSGIYNVGADVPHWGLTFAILDATRERSIEVHSSDISVPSLDDPGLTTIGIPHFHEMCRLCHGAPGYERTEFAEGLYPYPPHLDGAELQKELSNAELFWVVKHGLKMSGMPAFGGTHDDHTLWGVVAFVRQLPRLSVKGYKNAVRGVRHHEMGEEESDHHDQR